MPLQDGHVEEVFPWLGTRGAESARETTEHVHDGFRGDLAGCGGVVVKHVGDIEVFEGGILICGDNVGSV